MNTAACTSLFGCVNSTSATTAFFTSAKSPRLEDQMATGAHLVMAPLLEVLVRAPALACVARPVSSPLLRQLF